MAKGKNKHAKHPKAPLLGDQDKTPRTASKEGSFYEQRPAWRVSRVELVDPYGWHLLPAATLMEIRQKLGQFEALTWREIIARSNGDNHFMPVTKICNDAQARLRDLRLDDTDSLFSLRLSARERIWGILADGVMLLLWWDPYHQVYPVAPRNT